LQRFTYRRRFLCVFDCRFHQPSLDRQAYPVVVRRLRFNTLKSADRRSFTPIPRSSSGWISAAGRTPEQASHPATSVAPIFGTGAAAQPDLCVVIKPPHRPRFRKRDRAQIPQGKIERLTRIQAGCNNTPPPDACGPRNGLPARPVGQASSSGSCRSALRVCTALPPDPASQ